MIMNYDDHNDIPKYVVILLNLGHLLTNFAGNITGMTRHYCSKLGR